MGPGGETPREDRTPRVPPVSMATFSPHMTGARIPPPSGDGEAEPSEIQLEITGMEDNVRRKRSDGSAGLGSAGLGSLGLNSEMLGNARVDRAELQQIMEDAEAQRNASRADKMNLLKEHRLREACCIIDEDKKPQLRSVWSTTSRQLGHYGVGVQLYFDYHILLAVLFLLMFFLSMPAFIFFVMGSLISDDEAVAKESLFYRILASTTVANLGTCQQPQCWLHDLDNLADRPITAGSQTKVKDVTVLLGTLDGVVLLLFLLTCFGFYHYWIPRAVERQDAAHITAADYAVQVFHLPPRLSGEAHGSYHEDLKAHFQNLIRKDVRDIDEDGGIADITLVRDYKGLIPTFSEEGSLIKEKTALMTFLEDKTEAGEHEVAERYYLKALATEARIQEVRASLGEQGHTKDEDRDVVGAFVMFTREKLKYRVLHKYRLSHSPCFRPCQKRKYQFHKKSLVVSEAPEPNELYWENLDYPSELRRVRQFSTCILTVVLLIISLSLAAWLMELPSSDATFNGAPVWVVRAPAGGCVSLCDVEFSVDPVCQSANLGVYNTFTAASGSQGFMQDMLGIKGASSNASNCITSCDNANSWVAVNFTKSEELVKCWRFSQPPADVQTQLEFYSCLKTDLPSTSDALARWDPPQNCTRMQDAIRQTSEPKWTHVLPDKDCDQPVNFATAQHGVAFPGPGIDYREVCFCTQRHRQDPSYLWGPFNTPEKRLCESWAKERQKQTQSYYGGVVIVLVLNSVIWIVLALFDMFAKHTNLSSMTSTQLLEAWGAQFVNSSVVLLGASLKFYDSFKNIGLGVFDNFIGNGPHDEFTRGWFVQVGSGYIVTMIGLCASSLVLAPIMSFVVYELMVRWYLRDQTLDIKQLKQLYVWPEFQFSFRLAATNCILFCIFMYAGSMPILYLVGFVYFTLAYWVDKYCLLRGSSQPDAHGKDNVEISVWLWPIGAILHVITQVFMYSPELFPSERSWMEGFGEWLAGMDRAEYFEVMDIWRYGELNARKDILSKYRVRARIIDATRKAGWLLMLIVMVCIGYWVLVVLYQLVFKLMCQCDVLAKKVWHSKTVREKRQSYHGSNDMESLQYTRETYKQGLEIAERENRIFSYSLASSKKYQDASLGVEYCGTAPLEQAIPRVSGISLAQRVGLARAKSTTGQTSLEAAKSQGSGLFVEIVSAQGLRKADLVGGSDPYCQVGIDWKPREVFLTDVLFGTENPEWDHQHHMKGWEPGNDLRISVWDKDAVSSDFLGRAVLTSEQILQGRPPHQASGAKFDGTLVLEEAGEGVTATLHLRTEVLAPPRARTEEFADHPDDAEVHEEKEVLQAKSESMPETEEGHKVNFETRTPI